MYTHCTFKTQGGIEQIMNTEQQRQNKRFFNLLNSKDKKSIADLKELMHQKDIDVALYQGLLEWCSNSYEYNKNDTLKYKMHIAIDTIFQDEFINNITPEDRKSLFIWQMKIFDNKNISPSADNYYSLFNFLLNNCTEPEEYKEAIVQVESSFKYKQPIQNKVAISEGLLHFITVQESNIKPEQYQLLSHLLIGCMISTNDPKYNKQISTFMSNFHDNAAGYRYLFEIAIDHNNKWALELLIQHLNSNQSCFNFLQEDDPTTDNNSPRLYNKSRTLNQNSLYWKIANGHEFNSNAAYDQIKKDFANLDNIKFDNMDQVLQFTQATQKVLDTFAYHGLKTLLSHLSKGRNSKCSNAHLSLIRLCIDSTTPYSDTILAALLESAKNNRVVALMDPSQSEIKNRTSAYSYISLLKTCIKNNNKQAFTRIYDFYITEQNGFTLEQNERLYKALRNCPNRYEKLNQKMNISTSDREEFAAELMQYISQKTGIDFDDSSNENINDIQLHNITNSQQLNPVPPMTPGSISGHNNDNNDYARFQEMMAKNRI